MSLYSPVGQSTTHIPAIPAPAGSLIKPVSHVKQPFLPSFMHVRHEASHALQLSGSVADVKY